MPSQVDAAVETANETHLPELQRLEDISVDRVIRWYEILEVIGYTDFMDEALKVPDPEPRRTQQADGLSADGAEEVPLNAAARIDFVRVIRAAAQRDLMHEVVMVICDVEKEEAGRVSVYELRRQSRPFFQASLLVIDVLLGTA